MLFICFLLQVDCISEKFIQSVKGELRTIGELLESAGPPRDRNTLASIMRTDSEIVEGKIEGLIVLKGTRDSLSKGLGISYLPRHLPYLNYDKFLKKKFGFEYALINGLEIDTIDEEGVHTTLKNKILYLITRTNSEKKLPNDLEILETLLPLNLMPNDLYIKMLTKVKPVRAVFKIDYGEKGLYLGGTEPYSPGPGKKPIVDIAIYGSLSKEIMFLYQSSKDKVKKIGNQECEILGEFRGEQNKAQVISLLKLTTQEGLIELPVDEIIKFKKKD